MMNFSKRLRFRVLDERSGVGTGKARSLDALRPGSAARIVELAPSCRGFERRRMMDLGLVPGSVIERAEQAPFGGPIAFRLRGVTMALRPAQANMVAVEEM
ncbi:MAG: ferrous iron transport protein A [Opitutales bacterium]|nr:ferrous iron transport protein A [Opitutales bacterium]